jgi:gliding motility-associated-like protein
MNLNKFISSCILAFFFIGNAYSQNGNEISLPIKKSISERPHFRFMGEEPVYSIKNNKGLFIASSSPVQYGDQYTVGYEANESSSMLIEGNKKIVIKVDWFYTEKDKDVLYVFDGENESAPVIAKLSGTVKKGHLIVSNSNKVLIKFTSNEKEQFQGFRLRVDEANLIGQKIFQPMMTPNDPPADDCANAPVICNLGGYQGSTDIYTPDNTNITGFCGSVENNSWLSFIASDDTATIVFNSFNCDDPGSGIQALIYQTADCNNFTVVSNCVSQGNASGQFTITTNTPLVPGQKYYIMVDGYAGNVCDYTIAGGGGVATNLNISASPSVICPGGSVTLTASNVATSYSWISNPPTPNLGNTQTITVSPTVSTSYTLYAGPGQCATFGDTATTTVTITNTLPAPDITYPNPVCEGSTLVLGTNAGASGATYTWTGPNGFSSNLASPTIPNITPANSGNYSLTISYGSSCQTQTATENITVDLGPALVLSPSSSTICLGDNVTLTGSGAPSNPFFGANPYIYDWDPNETGAVTENCITIIFITNCNPNVISIPGVPAGPEATFTPNQSTQICIRSSTTSGCQGKACADIIVAAPTSVIASNDKTICEGDSVLLTASNAASYTWSLNSTTVGNGDSIYVKPVAGTYTYTVTAPKCGGGSSTDNVVVTVNPSPSISLTNSNPVFCSGGSSTLTASGANTYTWSPSAGLNTTTGSTVIANPLTSTIYTVTGSNGGACSGKNTTLVNVIRTPDVQVDNDTLTTCPGEGIIINASGATSYSWTSNAASAGNGSSISVNPTVQTLYTVVGTNGNTCRDTAYTLINIAANLTITVSPSSSSVCQGSSTGVSLTATGGTVYYTWTPTTGLGSTTTGPDVTANPTTNTTYTVTASTKPNGAGCTGVGYATISVTSPVSMTQPPQAQKCPNGNSLNIAPGNLSSLPSNITYSWVSNPSITNTSGASATVNPTLNTNYTLIANPGGCSSQIIIPVVVNANPTVNAVSNKDTVCFGNEVTLAANTGSGSHTYTWTSVNTIVSPGQQITNAFTGTNPNVYYVTVTNTSTGCSNRDSIIIITESVLASFTANPNPVDVGQTITFNNTSVGANSYSWNFGDTIGTSTSVNPTYIYNNDGTYTVLLQASNSRGCSDTATLKITVNEIFALEIPNIFTPNGDSKNDSFKMIKAKGIRDFVCVIYNRWGLKVFEFNDKSGIWDGSKNSDGVYYYIVKYTDKDGNSGERTGNITIADSN